MSTLTQSLIPDFEFAKGCRFDTWNSFVEHLDGRSQPVSLKKVLGRKQGSLLWGLAQAAGQSLQSEMIALSGWHDGTVKLRAEDARILIELKEITDPAQPSVEQVIRAIGIAGVLPRLTAFSSSDEWSRLVQGLHEIFQSAQSQSAGALGQLANELGLTLSYQLPEWKRAARLRKSCLATWANALQEMLDRDGAVQARDSRWIPLLLATWTRTYRIAGQTGFQLDDETQQIWEWFLRYALRLLRADGTSMLAEPRVPFCPNLYHSAVATSTDKEDRAIARQVLPTEKPKKKRVKSKRRASEVFADPGTFSEWAGMGVLQQDWSPRSPRLALAYDESFFQVEVCCGETLFQVHGLPDISINGRLLNAEGEWEELVSHFDDDLDFVELQIRMEGGVLLQRQLCLIHDEQTVMIADAIFAPSLERIDYQNRLQIPDSIRCMQETENTEIYLRRKKVCALLLPIGLSEWRIGTRDQRFEVEDQHVIWHQSALGKTLYAPLFVDLDPANSVKPRTWRKLTVAETLEIVDDDVARAYRVRVGRQQWVLYKSFQNIASRTFLGQNYKCDLVLGRFEKDGNMQELLSLES